MKKIATLILMVSLALALSGCQPIEDFKEGFKQGFEQGMKEELEKQRLEEADQMLAKEAEKLGEQPNPSVPEDTSDVSEVSFESSMTTEDAIINMMYESMDILESENIPAYMEYFVLTPENYEYNLQLNLDMVEKYDLDYTLEDISILETTPTTAKVQVTQTTRRIGGDPDFRDNRGVFQHYLILDGLQWKFAGSEIISAQAIE